jgi:hypothetical protein
VPCQVEFRSRLIEAGSAGLPREYGARHQGRPSFGYFSWPRKKSDQPPGCPRQIFEMFAAIKPQLALMALRENNQNEKTKADEAVTSS